MGILDSPAGLGHVASVLAAVHLIALGGRVLARWLRQPEVIGEIVAGLLAGPAAVALLGAPTFHTILPPDVLTALKTVAKVGLVLFLVGLAHHIRVRSSARGVLTRRGVLWVSAGALVPPLLTGCLLAGWVLLTDSASLRGSAPLPSYVLMVAVSMAITAVPVMARILADRGLSESPAGQLALTSAIVIDAVGWLLLAIALSLGAGSATGFLHAVRALATGLLCGWAIRLASRTSVATRFAVRTPRAAALLLGCAAVAVALTVEEMGMTAILGAASVGFAMPAEESGAWASVTARVERAGRALVPAFFVVTGVTVLTGDLPGVSTGFILLVVALGCLGKGLGGYAGARLAGRPRPDSYRIAVLMNTRGLTELIVLQAGFSAGILTAPMELSLIVMALATTALTGPLLSLRAGQDSASLPQASRATP